MFFGAHPWGFLDIGRWEVGPGGIFKWDLSGRREDRAPIWVKT